MTNYKKRVETLRVIISSHKSLTNSTKLPAIVGESKRIAATTRMSNRQSGWLLAVLHTTRTLDSSLSELLAAKNWTVQTPSLGKYLAKLVQKQVLTQAEKSNFDIQIVHKRNKYMHEAGAMPSKLEADQILNEMHSCITIVLSRL